MEDKSWPIMRLAGESVTRGNTCTAMRVGKSSSTESFSALWWKEAQELTADAQELHLLKVLEDLLDSFT